MYWYRVLAPRVGVVAVVEALVRVLAPRVVATGQWRHWYKALALRVGITTILEVLTSGPGFSRFCMT